MPNYCINKNAQPTGEHEIHNLDKHCPWLPEKENQIPLGWHLSDEDALTKAKSEYPDWDIDGDYYCCKSIHTK